MDHPCYCPHYCLVLEPIAVIAEDLAMSLEEIDPGVRTIIAASAEEALTQLDRVPSVCLALVHANPARFSATPLGRSLAALDAFVVYMGDAAEQSGARADVLARPFSVEALAEVLAQAMDQPPDALSEYS